MTSYSKELVKELFAGDLVAVEQLFNSYSRCRESVLLFPKDQTRLGDMRSTRWLCHLRRALALFGLRGFGRGGLCARGSGTRGLGHEEAE